MKNRYTRLVALLVVAGCTTFCSRDPEVNKRKHFERGNAYAAEQKYPEAIIEYRNAITLDPRFGEARYRLAEAYVQINDAVGAYRESIRAADLMPDNLEAQIRAGAALLVNGLFEDAKSRAQSTLKRHPKSVEAQILLGNAMAGLKDLDGAIAEIKEALLLDPEESRVYMSLGVLQQAQGNVKEAEQTLRRATEMDPKSVTARLALAGYYWSTGRLAEAEKSIGEAVGLEPKNPDSNRTMAVFYLATGRVALAETYLKVMADSSKEPAAQIALADYYVSIKRSADARKVLETLAGRKELFGAMRSRLAAIDYADGKRQEAYAGLDRVLTQEPNNVQAKLLKGRFLFQEGRIDEALTHAQAAAKADPRSVQALYILGLINAKRRDVEEAAKYFTEVLKLNPRAVDAQIQLARLNLDNGKVVESLQFSEQAVKNQPANGLAHLMLARGLMARGDLKVAEAKMNALVASNPNSAPVLAQMGELYLLKKDEAAAYRSFERGQEADADSVEALTGLAAMDTAAGKVRAARDRVEARLARTPNDPRVLLLAARVYQRDADSAKAEEALRKVIEVDPANLQAYEMLGRLYLTAHRLEEAKREFDEVARLQPSAISADTMIAMIFELQNNPVEAQKRYEAIIAKDSRAAVAANNLAWIYAERGGNLDVALQLARTAKQQLPSQPEVSDTLGWVYYKKNLAALAIDPLKESIGFDPKNPIYHYHLGLAYAKNGDKAKARGALGQALKLSQSFDGAVEARKLFASLAG